MVTYSTNNTNFFNTDLPNTHLMAIFDGHSDHKVAQQCADTIVSQFSKQVLERHTSSNDVKTVLYETFETLHLTAKRLDLQSGCTVRKHYYY